MGGNRGIGSIDAGDGIAFQPRALVLNFAIADRLARTGAAIPVRYVESDGLEGTTRCSWSSSDYRESVRPGGPVSIP